MPKFYFFTPDELRHLLEQTISTFRQMSNVYDFSENATMITIDKMMAGLPEVQEDDLPFSDPLLKETD